MTVTALTGRETPRRAGKHTGVICDACGFERIGATEQDALNEAWALRIVREDRRFWMCGECEAHFQLVWALRELAASGSQ